MTPYPRTLIAAAVAVCLLLPGSADAGGLHPWLPEDFTLWSPTDALESRESDSWPRRIGLESPIVSVQYAQPLPTPEWSDQVESLPPLDRTEWLGPAMEQPPWTGHRFPRVSRVGFKIARDYVNFYGPENLICYTAAFGAGAIMANTGFDTTMQTAWQEGVRPTGLGTFFSGCNDIGDGWYALPIFGTAAVTGLVFEANPIGDAVGEWGSRTMRMFVVGAPPVYAMQWATGASRPGESSAGSDWKPFNDSNGVSGHAFIGAIPFLAAADMVESPLFKGTLYVCSTFVAFARMNENAHYPSQVFLGWYLAWASARAVDATEMQFAGFEVSVVPLPVADLGGMAVEARW
jgi:membrane-associated phospholipid phosphatase